ncbi:hypothetical protein [Mesorhizobium sp. NZP2298]|uniref:hypothetical protein n=1 Tax=Mesorhizobium sp. NZP2298 TaxID=2483403 RepID=UPI0015528B9C|nr:hypothetical protein [Mesorhizobium sp. NZP2298]QKC99215.1 hypothetical protein EB231_35095 [Mesorhizobium sp. NZP2298]
MKKIELGALVRVQLEGRVVARDEMGDNGYLVEHGPEGDVKQDWIPPEIIEAVTVADGGGI